ncbi:MAG: flavin reductase family protein [Sneathiellaceae bacterium]
MADLTRERLRDAFGGFATGVAVITAATGQGDHGMTANAFMSVSLDPPLVSISLSLRCRMLGYVRQSGRYVVNVLRHDMEPLARHFAGQGDPALAIRLARTQDRPVIAGAVAQFFADVQSEILAGDHAIVIGRVTDLRRDAEARPLLFCGGKFGQMAPAAEG